MEQINLDANEQQIQAILEELDVANVSLENLPALSDGVVEGIYSFAYTYYEKGFYKESEVLFRLLTALRIRSVKYWKGLAAVFQMRKMYPEAIEAYGWAAVNDKELIDPYPHFHAAECLYTLNDLKKGLQALNSAKTIAVKQGCYQTLVKQIEFLEKVWRKKVNYGRDKN